MRDWEQPRLLALAQLLTSRGVRDPPLQTAANPFVQVPPVLPLSVGDQSCKSFYMLAVED